MVLPSRSVAEKIELLVMAIDVYIQKNDFDGEGRFDIISYLVENGKWIREHIENAFYPF